MVVTVSDGGTGTISGVPVYVFSGVLHQAQLATSDTNGQATFNLPEGSYLPRRRQRYAILQRRQLGTNSWHRPRLHRRHRQPRSSRT
ncbi:MAG: hypothetical protein R2856_27050 [Caldilineaceae bacterium]